MGRGRPFLIRRTTWLTLEEARYRLIKGSPETGGFWKVVEAIEKGTTEGPRRSTCARSWWSSPAFTCS
jgi:hypothetical protein